jgi:hypothetical protein
MNLKNKYHVLIIVFLLLLPCTYSCQKAPEEQSKSAAREVISSEARPNTRTADLLASMNMYHFSDPVKAPDFELMSVQGEKVSLAQYRGQAIMLSFWATW